MSHRFKSLLSAFFGLFLILFFLNIMKTVHSKRKTTASSKVQFDISHKKNKQRKIKKREKKKKVSKKKNLKPRLDLAFSQQGLGLGLDILGLSSSSSRLLSQTKETAMTEDIVDELPVVQHRPNLIFPDKAREDKVHGFVTVNLLVNKSGQVEKVKLIQAQPEGYFEQAALQGVKEWSFSPASYQGRFVAVWVKQKIKFEAH